MCVDKLVVDNNLYGHVNIPGLFPLTVKHVDKVVVIAVVVVAEVVVVVLPTFPSHPGHPFPHTPHSPWMWTP